MKGGARTSSGPAPDPNALSRDEGEWTLLPAKARGEAPAWPLLEQSEREGVLWAVMWAKPQALMWVRNGQELEVALWVRSFAEAEKSDSTVAVRTLVRQMSDSLGLTTPGMRNNRWKIVADEVAPRREASRRPSSRARLTTAVDVVSA